MSSLSKFFSLITIVFSESSPMKKQTRIFLSYTLILFAFATKSQVRPTIVWVNNGGAYPDVSSVSTALAANSNVHVAGRISTTPSNDDIIVQCTDSASNILWTFPYDNGGFDSPEKIWVDNLGNTYIAGISFDAGNKRDYICIKLDNTGSQVWLQRFDGGFNADDEAFDLVIDNNYDVYITGRSDDGTSFSAVTLKLDGSSGSPIWQHVFNPSGLNCSGVSMVIANNNVDIIVGSNVEMGSGNTDIFAYQISASSGVGGWQTQITGSGGGNDVCSKIILAGANVVLCGMVDNGVSGNDYTTVKIDASGGGVLFQNDYDYGLNDKATSLVRDSTGNIAVTGYVYNIATSIFKYNTLCYDSTGVLLWLNQQNTNSPTLNVDPVIVCDTIAHHFYVSGEKENSDRDIFVYQITPSGSIGWEKTYDAGSGSLDVATSLVVNGIGVVFLSGNTSPTPGFFKITTLKVAQTPVYFPPDYNNVNEPYAPNHYFYKNSGEILLADTSVSLANEVLYYTKNTSPQQFVLSNNNMSFLFAKTDTSISGLDSLHRIDLEFDRSNPLATAFNFDEKDDGVLNYYLGKLGPPITNVKGSTKIMIPEIYPGIDLHYYSNNQGLKMYFVVKPGYSSEVIKLDFIGAKATAISSGDLTVSSNYGDMKFAAPQAYNVNYVGGLIVTSLTSGASFFNTTGDSYKLLPGTYNPYLPLVIQINQGNATSSSIANVNWSTYLGSASNEMVTSIKTDGNNNLFTVGRVFSTSFPQAPGVIGYQNSNGGGADGFVSKFKPNHQLEWSTFIGGSKADHLTDLAINLSNQIYCVGNTLSNNLLTVPKGGALNNSTYSGGTNETDGFIFQLSQTGSCAWLTYYGGTREDYLSACTFDSQNNFFIVGWSSSTDIPVVAVGLQYSHTNPVAGDFDGIIAKFNSSSAVTWATYIGSSTYASPHFPNDRIYDIVVNYGTVTRNAIANGDIYIVGNTDGDNYPDMPTLGSSNYPSYNNNTGNGNDAFITRFANSGQMTWSTIFGGSDDDWGKALAINNNSVYITGTTNSTDFLSVNSGIYYSQSTFGGSYWDAYFMVVDDNNAFIHSTYLGGNSGEIGYDIIFDQNSTAYIAGISEGQFLPAPSVNPINTYNQAYSGGNDNFICALKANNTSIIWSSYLGGTQDEAYYQVNDGYHLSICADGNNHLYLGGLSWSGHTQAFPLDDAGGSPAYFQGIKSGSTDGTITEFDLMSVITGINEIGSNPTSISIFPNPASSRLYVKLSSQLGDASYKIINTLGQIVGVGKLNFANNSISLNDLSVGLYIIEVNNNGKSYSSKFIKNE